MPITNHVRKHRETAGLTQEQLAVKLGVSRQTINAVETGRYEPSLTLALKLAKIFKVPAENLFVLP